MYTVCEEDGDTASKKRETEDSMWSWSNRNAAQENGPFQNNHFIITRGKWNFDKFSGLL